MNKKIKDTKSDSSINIKSVNKKWQIIKKNQILQESLNQLEKRMNTYPTQVHEFMRFLNNIKYIASPINYQQPGSITDYFLKNFALNDKQEIYFIHNIDFIFTTANYQSIFQKFNCSSPPLEFIDSLYKLLSLRQKTDPHYIYMNYKFQSRSYSCIFDHTECFRLFDGNILFDDSSMYKNTGSFIKSTLHILLHEKTYMIPIKANNSLAEKNTSFQKLNDPTSNQFKAIATILRKRAIKDTAFESRYQIIFKHLYQHLKPSSIDLHSSEDNNTAINILNQYQLSLTPHQMPVNFIEFLLKLTNGSQNAINQLAMLIARINLIKKPQEDPHILPKLTIILTSNVQVVKEFFVQLYEHMQKNSKSICELSSQTTIENNIFFKLNGGILQVFEHRNPVNPGDLKILKKMVKCVPVHTSDKTVGRITYISNCHHIILVKKPEDILVYKNFFQNSLEVIKLNEKVPNKRTKKPPTFTCQDSSTLSPYLDHYDYQWIQIIFASYGLLLLHEKKTISEKILPLVDPTSTVTSFLSECCTFEPTADCYAHELYLLYKNYVLKNHGVDSVKKIHLVDILKGRYEYFRPRHHAKDNCWGFKGIAIKKDKLLEYTESSTDSNSGTIQVENEITQYIEKINKKIFPLLGVD